MIAGVGLTGEDLVEGFVIIVLVLTAVLFALRAMLGARGSWRNRPHLSPRLKRFGISIDGKLVLDLSGRDIAVITMNSNKTYADYCQQIGNIEMVLQLEDEP